MPAERQDLIGQLLEDHKQIEDALSGFDDDGDHSKWSQQFSALTNLLVRHEVAEEEILYPEVRRALPDGNRLAEDRIHEQSEAEELLSEMERAGAHNERFSGMLAKLRTAVQEHAQKEESTVFAALGSALDQEHLNRLGGQYNKAKALAPTHPHPGAPDSPPGNIAADPVATVVDRVRDAVNRH